MDILKKSWIEVEVHSQLKNLIAARRNLYSDAKSKKPGNSGSLEALITREDSIGLAGELQISPKMVNWPPLQVKKWIYYTPTEPPPGSGQQPRFITGELSDTASTIICEFTPSCVSSFEKTEGRRITERSIGNIVQLLEFDLVFQGSDGLLFWENYDYQDQCDSSKAVKKRGKSSKPLPTRLKNPQVPVPEPRFRVYKFKVLSSDESQIFGNPQARRPKHLITTLPRKSLVDKGLRESSAKREVKEMTKPHISAESDTDELNFESQHTSPAKWGQKHRESFEDGDISQMAFATQIGQFSPPRAGSCHNSASPNPASSRSSEMPDADRSEDWKRRMDDCATDLKRTIQALRHLPMVKGTKSAPKVTGGNTGNIPVDEQLGRSSTGIAPPFEGSAGQSSYSGLASREGTSDVSPGSKKSARKLERPKKPIELLPLNTMLHLHPGWQGMKEVTRMDVTIPKGQLMVLETDVAWYPRKEHLAHRNTPSTHDNVAIQSPCNRGSPQGESSAVLPSLPNYSDSDSELSWSPSPVAQNAMPPDSSAIQPSETPVPRRLKDSCRRCKDYELICSSLHFQTESRCESCHNAGESCEYGHAAEGVSRRKRRKTHQKVTDDATEDGEEGESHPTPTWKKTRREVATSGTDFSYADPELDEFSFIANQTVKGSILLQRESTIEKPASDMVQGASINKKPQDNSTCSISSTNKPSTQRSESSYEDPEFGDFSVIIKKPANKVSTASQKDGGLKKRGFEGKLSIASSCELDVFLSTKKSKAKSANCTRKNANRKESARELPSKSVPKQLKDSVVTSAGSDTDGETQLMLNPHGTTNVAKFGLLRSQALVYKKEEERKKQERLSLGLPEEEEEEGVTDFRISEPEPYDGYSSSEDKEQRQRKARSITANCSSDHSGPNDGLASPTHPRDAFRQNDSEVDSLEDPPQAVPASNRVKSSTSNAMSQLVVRESPRKLTAQEPIVLEDHHEDEDEEDEDDEIPQAIPTAYVAPRTSHIAVVQVHAIESDKRGKLQELEPVSDVASPNGDARKPSASIALTSRDQIPLPAHEKKYWDTPSRDVPQPERAKFSLSPGDKPAIQEVLFPSTAPQRQSATIQVKDTPYPLAKSISYKKLTAAGAFKTLGSDEIPAVPCLEGDEIIPCTASSSQPFDAVIPVQQGIKRKNCVENSTAESKKGWKRPRVRKLEFGSQEAGFKDLSDLAKEHKKRYLESVGSSIKSVEELDGHKNERMQAPDGQRIAAEKGPVVAPLPPPPTKSLLSVNTAIPSPTLMQTPKLKLKVSPVSVAQMSLSSRRSSTSTRRRKQSHPKSESSTQKALKAIIAAKRASLSGNSPGPISPSNALFTSVSPASRSSTVSRTSHKVMKPVSSRNTYSVPSLAFATHSGCLPDQHNPSPKTHPPTKAAQHALKVLNSDDTASDTEDVISARPPPPRTQEVQTTLIPSMAAPPLPEKPERIGNYASIEGRDINVLIPGYNRLSAEKKSRLNERRKAYFGPGELVMQSSELVTAEEESRQRRIQEFRNRFKEEVPKKKLWWQEDDTPVRSYGRKLGAVKSVKQELERRDEGVTRVEVERLSRGGMLKNIMRML